MKETRPLNDPRARRLRATKWIAGGAAILAFAALIPSLALAATLTLTPTSAFDASPGTQVLTAQLSGECSGGTDTGVVCTSNADCQVTCSFTSGVPIYFKVLSGPNAGDLVSGITDANGQATSSIIDTVPGLDTVAACSDPDDPTENPPDTQNFAECITEADGEIQSAPSTVSWQVHSVSLAPLTAVNLAGPLNGHTLSAQVNGVAGKCDGGVNNNNVCATDADCTGGDTCDYSGYKVLFAVSTGPNTGEKGSATTDRTGLAALSYLDTGGTGLDTAQACLDLDNTDTTAAACILDAGDFNDQASNTVTKRWITVPASIVLTPATGTNPVGPTVSHSVTATLSGNKLGLCTNAGANFDHGCDLATQATDCASVVPLSVPTCDMSGTPVEVGVISGPNTQEFGFQNTNSAGQVSETYFDLGGAGLDSILACADVLPEGDDSTTAGCASDPPVEDLGSNTVTKRWEETPTVMLFNLDLGATLIAQASNPAAPPVLTKSDAFNPVGGMHTVEAVVTGGKLGICTNAGANFDHGCDVATASTDCASVSGTPKCDVSGIPVGFTVLPGSQNPGDFMPTTWVNTDMNGVAADSYTDTNGAGKDLIEACLDTDGSGSTDESTGVAGCIADSATAEFGDYATNEVTKYWLSKFVTGGGKVVIGKTWDTFGGVVGQKPNSTALTGEWQQVAHAAKGGNLQCHWSAFSTFALSCSTGSCGTSPNTVVFKTMGGSAACGNETVKIVDGQKKPDTIEIVSTVAALDVPAGSPLSGNFTIHK